MNRTCGRLFFKELVSAYSCLIIMRLSYSPVSHPQHNTWVNTWAISFCCSKQWRRFLNPIFLYKYIPNKDANDLKYSPILIRIVDAGLRAQFLLFIRKMSTQSIYRTKTLGKKCHFDFIFYLFSITYRYFLRRVNMLSKKQLS